MSNFTVAADEVGVHRKTLTPSTADKVTFAKDLERVEVISDGAAELFFTVDGTVPTVDGAHTYRLPAGGSSVREVSVPTAGGTQVQLISPGAPTYSVSQAI